MSGTQALVAIVTARTDLLWAAWRCLLHYHRGPNGITAVVSQPVEALHGWHLCQPCDALLLAEFARCVATALPYGQPGDPEGYVISVRTNRGEVELWAGWDEARPDEQRPADAKGADLVALLRRLMEADDPPSPPTRASLPDPVIAAPCPSCGGKGRIGPVHVNTGRQPHRWMTVPCPACAEPATDPLGRLVQAVVAQADAAEAAAPAPAVPEPAPAAGQLTLF